MAVFPSLHRSNHKNSNQEANTGKSNTKSASSSASIISKSFSSYTQGSIKSAKHDLNKTTVMAMATTTTTTAATFVNPSSSSHASSAVSRVPPNTSPLAYDMIETRGLNDIDLEEEDVNDYSSGNYSQDGPGNTCRSTSSGDDWKSGVGDDSSVASRREYEQRREVELAARETRAVGKLKLLVFGSLFLSMIAVVLSAYFLTSQAEQDNFEHQFYDDSNKILGNIGQNLERIMEASDAFVSSIASYAAHSNQTWPYVVVPDFAVQAEKVRSLCGAVYVNTYYVVQDEQRKEWERFTASVGRETADASIAAIEEYDAMDWPINYNYTETNVIFSYDEFEGEGVTYDGPYLPMWQTQPTLAETECPYNWDLMSIPPIPGQERSVMEIMMEDHRPTITVPYLLADKSNPARYQEDLDEANWLHDYLPNVDSVEEVLQPLSDFAYPIFANSHERIQFNTDGHHGKDEHAVVALFSASVYWKDQIRDILPEGSAGVLVVFESECASSFTYEVNGPNVVYLGTGDHSDSKYDYMTQGALVSDLRFYSTKNSTYSGLLLEDSYCPIYVSIHASEKMEAIYKTSTPWIFAVVTACVFLLTVLTFMFYNYVVEQRQKVVLKSAVASNAIVSSLFPETVKRQLEMQAKEQLGDDTLPKGKLSSFLNDGNDNKEAAKNTKQIAELFPETTVLFADIAGFTAWASSREPSHVFTLLEALYGAFDLQAKKMGIFKVETIGDSYVAVCGLPEPNQQHAIKMAKFASSCLELMATTTATLELSLGPGTADLALRVGMHSGPTIAGVLRGEKARFQLFGDTVNTASRMESSSQPNKIQVSQKTAELIVEANRGHWLTARKDLVNAKGKGLLQTYWLNPRKARTGSVVSSVEDLASSNGDMEEQDTETMPFSSAAEISDDKLLRLINWNVELFEEMLKPIVQRRMESQGGSLSNIMPVEEQILANGASPRDKIVPSVRMPGFKVDTVNQVDLGPEAASQLRNYITSIANLYNSANAFHNFEHASHVIMSTLKLLQRASTNMKLDPLTKFAICFSALIHDLDHYGVSNGQLVKEEDPIAVTYDGLSPMEQHSFTLAFELLMEDSFSELRAQLFDSQEEFNRFEQLCINCVIATDVFDKDLKLFREQRWDAAFATAGVQSLTAEETWQCKATIAIEYIIQASDVAHTMQHWHVYQRWNKRLFMEMYAAYKAGRAEKDPTEGWYGGELWFFDNYIIPLAEKLRQCEVFGVDCDQLLTYATENRSEWEKKGADIVKTWREEQQEAGSK